MAAALPLVTFFYCKMRTVSGEGPTVMQSPYYTNMMFFYVAKQHGEINAEIMEIVQVNNIRREFPQLSQQLQGATYGKQTVCPKKDAGVVVKKRLQTAAPVIMAHDMWKAFPYATLIFYRTESAYLMAVPAGKLCGLKHYLTGAAIMKNVDGCYFHLVSSLHMFR